MTSAYEQDRNMEKAPCKYSSITNNLLKSNRSHAIAIAVLVIFGFGIRMYKISQFPTDYHPTRQYISANITRGEFYEENSNRDSRLKHIALLNAEREMHLEPRFMETIVVGGYYLLGRESLLLPRTLSVIFWLIGGVFVYLLMLKFSERGTALLSFFLYIFFPFAILGSRAFQPDILMVMLALAAFYLIWRYFEEPTWLRLLWAAAISCASVFTKPVSIFFIVGAFGCLAWEKKRIIGALKELQFWVFAILALAPPVVYYLVGISANEELGRQSSISFVPALILQAKFWLGWLRMIGRTVGVLPFLAALVGILLFKEKKTRVFLAGLWGGYFVYGLIFTHHIHTHDYYSLILIPLTAMSCARFLTIGACKIAEYASKHPRRTATVAGAATIIVLVALTGAFSAYRKGLDPDQKKLIKNAGLAVGLSEKFLRFLHPNGEQYGYYPAMAKEIGELVEHSGKTIFLTHDYGKTLMYHGWIAGYPWPENRQAGVGAGELLKKFLEREEADYFIVTSVGNFLQEQADLESLLRRRYSLLAANDNYIIYDLRKK